jgi:hypothetical protein
MSQNKVLIVALTALVVGFAGGFVMRPVILPVPQSETVADAPPMAATSSEARGVQYFVAHLEEARQIVAGCRDGSVRGGECATAEEAIIKVDAQERRKRFVGT